MCLWSLFIFLTIKNEAQPVLCFHRSGIYDYDEWCVLNRAPMNLFYDCEYMKWMTSVES